MYDDEVRKWVGGIGVENMGKKLVNSKDGPVTFEKPAMTIDKLMSYGFMLVQEQENVKRVQLAESYLSSAALGDANEDAIKQGTFFGKLFVDQMYSSPLFSLAKRIMAGISVCAFFCSACFICVHM